MDVVKMRTSGIWNSVYQGTGEQYGSAKNMLLFFTPIGQKLPVHIQKKQNGSAALLFYSQQMYIVHKILYFTPNRFFFASLHSTVSEQQNNMSCLI